MINQDNLLKLIGRSSKLFEEDINSNEQNLSDEVKNSSFLVIGGAGSIGQAVTKEIFKRNPRKLYVVDISENNLVELVRDIRSSLGYIDGEFKTFAIDAGSKEFKMLLNSSESFDYCFNLSALKHVRSEKDPFTLMRMINVNIINTLESFQLIKRLGGKKYFCVSTDKAANPVNIMGATKKVMEDFLMSQSINMPISLSRFANVAFSDGSLLQGFNSRIAKQQPIAAPFDVRRYFITPEESGELCLISGLLGQNRDILFPKLTEKLHEKTFSEIAQNYLNQIGYEPFLCQSEEEARRKTKELIPNKIWPCYFFKSDTTGEKDFEEFFTDKEEINMDKFKEIGVIKNSLLSNPKDISLFKKELKKLEERKSLERKEIVNLFSELLPEFNHIEKGKFLDEKM